MISPMPDRPLRIASQIDAASVPSAHSPPIPVMTMRWRAISGFLVYKGAYRGNDVADILEVVPGFNRVHLDLDAIGLFEIEHDFRQVQENGCQAR